MDILKIANKLGKATRIDNRYGVNKNTFSIDTEPVPLFVKFTNNLSAQNELEGFNKIRSYLPAPRLIKIENFSNDISAVIYEFIPNARLLTNIVIEDTLGQKTKRLESRKNEILLQMYSDSAQKVKTNHTTYISCPANRLFFHRMCGDRYQEYYEIEKPHNISSLFDKNIVLNGHKFSKKPIDIINNIKSKYSQLDSIPREVSYVLGHGDAHHQNILCIGESVVFTDFEYSGLLPVRMELAKPYYIDFIGTLFFFFQDDLIGHFNIDMDFARNEDIILNIKLKNELRDRISITKNKTEHFYGLIREATDILLFNDYLLICHLLSRNPNAYSKKAQSLFLSLIPVIAEFDPSSPESLFSYF